MALVDRVKKILLQPNDEWGVINSELTNAGTLYKTYIIPLAAIGPVCEAIGWSLIGMSVPFVGTVRLDVLTAITQAAIGYLMSLVGVFIIALAIDGLAPSFRGHKNQVQALKVSAYAWTAAWVADALLLIPPLFWVSVLAGLLYGGYLLYLGLSPLMKVPKDMALPYTAIILIIAVVVSVVLSAIRTALLPSLFHMGPVS
jgi:hypothetical protein